MGKEQSSNPDWFILNQGCQCYKFNLESSLRTESKAVSELLCEHWGTAAIQASTGDGTGAAHQGRVSESRDDAHRYPGLFGSGVTAVPRAQAAV